MTPENDRDRDGVALLVDGENIPAIHADELITYAGACGRLVVKRVYGNIVLLGKWDTAPDFRMIHAGTARNSADMLLAVEAVDLAHSGTVQTFVIATSDGDFSHLAHHLCERGFTVVGIGEAKAPLTFRRACTRFEQVKPRPIPAKPKLDGLDDLDVKIVELIRTHGNQGAIRISAINGPMRIAHKFKISDHEKKTWRSYLTSKPTIYDCDKKGPDARVRLVI